MVRIPLRQRPLDMLWFAFCLIHIPASLCIDMQPLYPEHLVPNAPRSFLQFYLKLSGDPLMRNFVAGDPSVAWFKSFITLEAVFQVPIFFIGAYCLYHDLRAIYPWLLIYGVSSLTTQLPCFQYFLTWNARATTTAATRISSGQMLVLLQSYVPFFLAPLGLVVDMTARLSRAQRVAQAVEGVKKRA